MVVILPSQGAAKPAATVFPEFTQHLRKHEKTPFLLLQMPRHSVHSICKQETRNHLGTQLLQLSIGTEKARDSANSQSTLYIFVLNSTHLETFVAEAQTAWWAGCPALPESSKRWKMHTEKSWYNHDLRWSKTFWLKQWRLLCVRTCLASSCVAALPAGLLPLPPTSHGHALLSKELLIRTKWFRFNRLGFQ